MHWSSWYLLSRNPVFCNGMSMSIPALDPVAHSLVTRFSSRARLTPAVRMFASRGKILFDINYAAHKYGRQTPLRLGMWLWHFGGSVSRTGPSHTVESLPSAIAHLGAR